MKIMRSPLFGIGAAVLLLAGCSAGAASTGAPSADAATSAAPSAGSMPQQGMGGGGVSGEVVLAQDGLAQVQDSQSQTAVRYTADTTVQQQVSVALADVTVGSCVVAIVGDDGTATTVTVSDPVDGECSSGFGGGQGGGQFPGGQDGAQPTAMPTAMPSAMPSGAPGDGQIPDGGFGGTFVTGSVSAVTASGLTVTTDDGAQDVVIGDDSTLTGTEDADGSAILVGLCLTAQGTADDAGGFDATSITLSAKGDDGCSVRGFGGMGGGMRGNGQGGDQNGGGNG